MIIFLFLVVVQLVSGAVPMVREQARLFDDVEGVLMEVPEYEDPLMLEHQLSAMGAMPIFTLLDKAKKQVDHKEDDLSEKLKIAQSKKIIDDVVYRLQSSRSKLDKGATNIYVDLEKSIQSLKKLEKISRPDARQVLNSLQALMSMAKPLIGNDAKAVVTTNKPEAIVEQPSNYDSQAIAVRVIPTEKPLINEKQVSVEKPIFNEKPVFDEKQTFYEKPIFSEEPVSDEKPILSEKPVSYEKPVSDEKPVLDEKPVFDEKPSFDEKPVAKGAFVSQSRDLKSEIVSEDEKSEEEIKKPVDAGILKKSQEQTKKSFVPEFHKKEEKSPESEEVMSYKTKITWKSAGML